MALCKYVHLDIYSYPLHTIMITKNIGKNA